MDATRDIWEGYARRDSRIRYLRELENRGLNWNHCRVFAQSRAEYVRWAAADDVPSPSLIGEMVSLLESDPGIVLCIPHSKQIDAAGNLVRVTRKLAI